MELDRRTSTAIKFDRCRLHYEGSLLTENLLIRDEYNFDFEQGDSVHRGLEALRAQINVAQNQCFGLKDLLLAVRWRRCSRLGRASSPTVGEPCMHHSKSAISAHGRFLEVP